MFGRKPVSPIAIEWHTLNGNILRFGFCSGIVYTYVLNRGGKGVKSLADNLRNKAMHVIFKHDPKTILSGNHIFRHEWKGIYRQLKLSYANLIRKQSFYSREFKGGSYA